MKRSSSWTHVGETLEAYIERIGLCLHTPTCKESAACRALRAKEKPQPTAYTGEARQTRKIDFEE